MILWFLKVRFMIHSFLKSHEEQKERHEQEEDDEKQTEVEMKCEEEQEQREDPEVEKEEQDEESLQREEEEGAEYPEWTSLDLRDSDGEKSLDLTESPRPLSQETRNLTASELLLNKLVDTKNVVCRMKEIQAASLKNFNLHHCVFPLPLSSVLSEACLKMTKSPSPTSFSWPCRGRWSCCLPSITPWCPSQRCCATLSSSSTTLCQLHSSPSSCRFSYSSGPCCLCLGRPNASGWQPSFTLK